jgi:hypothetical protein
MTAVLGAISFYCGLRFVLDVSQRYELMMGLRYLSAALIGMCVSTRRLQRRDLLWIAETIALAMTGVALLSIVAAVRDAGPSSLAEFFRGDARLGHLDGLGANSFAYLCAVGFFCGIALLLHRRSPFVATGAATICGVAMLMSRTLGTLVPAAALVTLLVLDWMSARANRRVLVLVAVLLAVAFLTLQFDAVYAFLRLDTKDLASVSGRALVWQYCASLIASHPFGGVDHSSYVRDAFLWVQYPLAGGGVDLQPLTPHNFVISSLTFYGLPLGGALIVGYVGSTWQAMKQAVGTHSRALACLPVLGFLSHMTLDMWFFLFLWVFVIFAVPASADCSPEVRVPRWQPMQS